jgi:hypothetical protein
VSNEESKVKKIRKRSASWLVKSARRGFRGYPIATWPPRLPSPSSSANANWPTLRETTSVRISESFIEY